MTSTKNSELKSIDLIKSEILFGQVLMLPMLPHKFYNCIQMPRQSTIIGGAEVFSLKLKDTHKILNDLFI